MRHFHINQVLLSPDLKPFQFWYHPQILTTTSLIGNEFD